MSRLKLNAKEWADLTNIFAQVIRDPDVPFDHVDIIDSLNSKVGVKETYMRLGPLLIGGAESLKKILVYTPTEGLVNVTLTAEGPWWHALRESLPQWQAEFTAYVKENRLHGNLSKQKRKEKENKRIVLAEAAFNAWLFEEQSRQMLAQPKPEDKLAAEEPEKVTLADIDDDTPVMFSTTEAEGGRLLTDTADESLQQAEDPDEAYKELEAAASVEPASKDTQPERGITEENFEEYLASLQKARPTKDEPLMKGK
jgi:hypothetical protein